MLSKEDKRRLLKQAIELYALGRLVDRKQNQLRRLIERGVPYDSPKMQKALEQFIEADAERERLEANHLTLRQKFESQL